MTPNCGLPELDRQRGGSRDRTQSPPTISAKREYSRTWPETFANWRPEITDLGVWGRKRPREKPAFPAHSRVSPGSLTERQSAWLGRKGSNHRMADPPFCETQAATILL